MLPKGIYLCISECKTQPEFKLSCLSFHSESLAIMPPIYPTSDGFGFILSWRRYVYLKNQDDRLIIEENRRCNEEKIALVIR